MKLKFKGMALGDIMKENKSIEEKLLSQSSLDDLIKLKMEEELRQEILSAKAVKKKTKLTEILKVPQHLIFSKESVFRLFNKITKIETFINGVQAEALLGLQNLIRERVQKGEMDAFSTDNCYVKFEYCEIRGEK